MRRSQPTNEILSFGVRGCLIVSIMPLIVIKRAGGSVKKDLCPLQYVAQGWSK
jgi:hypothetical protein